MEPAPVTSSSRALPVPEATAEGPDHRFSGATLASLAAVAGLLAIALSSWAVAVTAGDSEDSAVPSSASSIDRRLVTLLAQPGTERFPLKGSVGRIVLAVSAQGRGMLVLDGLGRSPAGRAYQAWLLRPGVIAGASAAVFDGSRMLVPLRGGVPMGATVAVTLERAGGAPAPTRTPRLLARRQ
jgi:Anti-sigma-K factor rskA